MSTTLEGIDARSYLQNWLNSLLNMYSADIKALPDDKWQASMGGCTRTACQLTSDAISFLDWTTGALQGNPAAGGESDHMAAIERACDTKANALTKLNSSVEAFSKALSAASDESLQKMVMTPFGMEMPLFMVAQISVSHLWYHDGQLNYIQCLLGDDKIHWMGG